MARQIFTLLMFLVGGLFLLRTCNKPDPIPPALSGAEVAAPQVEELRTLTAASDQGEVVVRFDRAGRIVSLNVGGAECMRNVPAPRRALGVLLRLATGKTRRPKYDGWEAIELPGGIEFVHTSGDRTIRKRISLDGEKRGLRVALQLSGGGSEVHGIELTGPSGVALGRDDERGLGGAVIEFEGGRTRFYTFDNSVDFQENRRVQAAVEAQTTGVKPVSPRYHRQHRVQPGQNVTGFGVLGENFYVGLETLPAVAKLNIDAYRAIRDGVESDELETWLSLTVIEGSYDGDFQLRWTARDAVNLPDLQAQGVLDPAKRIWLENDTFKAAFTERGAALTELWLKSYALVAGKPPAEGNWIPILHAGVRPGSRALTLRGNPDVYGSDPANRVWKAETDEPGAIRFSLETPNGWHLEKRVVLPEPGLYDLGIEIVVRRPDASTATRARYTLVGPAGPYVEDSYRGIIGAELPAGILIERRGGENASENIDNLEKKGPLLGKYSQADRRGLARAVGTRGAYFVSALLTEERADDKGRPLGHVTEASVRWIELSQTVERPDGKSSRASMETRITCDVPVADGVARMAYRLYAGPNSGEDLEPLQIGDTIEWGMFGVIGRALMWLMKTLQGLIGSYGIAILLMTLIVRALLLPVSYRTQLGMQRYSKRLQKIKPEIDALQKKYGNNKDKLNRERMRVMREHKVGFPLGCLMIFFQFPIWIALFRALRVEFSLRHQPFLWIDDLSMPDQLFHMPWFANLPVVPEYFNLLPFLMLALWVMQQRLAPTPGVQTDPNVQMQAKMIRWMPYVFFFMLYNYAAALSLYMCVSSAWGIAEGKLVRRAVAKLD